MAKRKSISTRVRFEIFKRDNFKCQYCGRMPPQVILHIDHVVSVANGGDNSNTNLITSCQDCNLGKSDRPLTVVMPATNTELAERRERAKQLKSLNEFLVEERQAEAAAIERIGAFWFNQYKDEKDRYVFGPAREPSIRSFLRQLPEAELIEAIEIAFARKYPRNDYLEANTTWKYFCGVCWKKIRDRATVVAR